MNRALLLCRIFVLDDFQNFAVFSANDAPISFRIRHHCREHCCLCPRLHMLLMKPRKQFCCQKRSISAQNHDRSALPQQQFFRLQNSMSRSKLFMLLHIFYTVANPLSYNLSAKSRDDNIAPRTCRICCINNMLQHGFSRCLMQNLRQL